MTDFDVYEFPAGAELSTELRWLADNMVGTIATDGPQILTLHDAIKLGSVLHDMARVAEIMEAQLAGRPSAEIVTLATRRAARWPGPGGDAA